MVRHGIGQNHLGNLLMVNEYFFEEAREQSQVKTAIVQKYFDA